MVQLGCTWRYQAKRQKSRDKMCFDTYTHAFAWKSALYEVQGGREPWKVQLRLPGRHFPLFSYHLGIKMYIWLMFVCACVRVCVLRWCMHVCVCVFISTCLSSENSPAFQRIKWQIWFFLIILTYHYNLQRIIMFFRQRLKMCHIALPYY